jgi:hypothetical protein
MTYKICSICKWRSMNGRGKMRLDSMTEKKLTEIQEKILPVWISGKLHQLTEH